MKRSLILRAWTMSKNILLCSWILMINENDLFKHDWRSRSKVQVLQYIFLKWTLAFLVKLLTGIIATFINLAVENIAGYKHLSVVRYIEEERYLMGFIFFAGVNFILTMVAVVLCLCFTPTAAGPGIPEIKAYLNGVDIPNMFGATTLIVKMLVLDLYVCWKALIQCNKICRSREKRIKQTTKKGKREREIYKFKWQIAGHWVSW
ncbi:hypothetical protein CsSME_00025551 [Camellia sinensis var. sinensis]